MLFKDKLKEPVIYKGSNKAINELNQIQEYLKDVYKRQSLLLVHKQKEIYFW